MMPDRVAWLHVIHGNRDASPECAHRPVLAR